MEEEKPIVGAIPKNSLISVEALALYLNCSVEGLKKWLSKNEKARVRYRVINGKWVIDTDSLIDF